MKSFECCKVDGEMVGHYPTVGLMFTRMVCEKCGKRISWSKAILKYVLKKESKKRKKDE